MLKISIKLKNNYIILLLIFFILQIIPETIKSQNTFKININTSLDEFPSNFFLNSENDFVGTIGKANTSDYIFDSYIYKISSEGDTISKLFSKQDTIIYLNNIIQVNNSPVEYLITGLIPKEDVNSNYYFTYFAKLDKDFEIIWQKTYQLFNEKYSGCLMEILNLNKNVFLYAASNEPPRKMFLFRLSEIGDSLAYRMYENDSAGELYDLTYNYDSSAYWLHTHFAHYDPIGPESQCIVVDKNLNQTKVMYYPRWLAQGCTLKLLPDRNVIVGSRYRYIWSTSVEKYLGAFKLDTAFNVIDSCYFTNPDTCAQVGCNNAIDYYYPSCIYLGGIHNIQLYTWAEIPTWIAVARMDENLDIKYEKYIGGDANYVLGSVIATSDSGVLLTAYCYDWKNHNYDRDAIIIKLDNKGCLTSILNQDKVQLTSAIVYPNPGSDNIFIRTALKNVFFELYDIKGNLLIYKKINKNITKINSSKLNFGTYLWKVYDKTKVYNTGKWIKKN